jgi:hypothetical protein
MDESQITPTLRKPVRAWAWTGTIIHGRSKRKVNLREMASLLN